MNRPAAGAWPGYGTPSNKATASAASAVTGRPTRSRLANLSLTAVLSLTTSRHLLSALPLIVALSLTTLAWAPPAQARTAGSGAMLPIWGAATIERRTKGPAKVIDGDSLMIEDQEIRLFGIDAVEGRQRCHRADNNRSWRCGRAASRALRELVRGRTVRCTHRDVDRYGRIVAVCRVGNRDLGRWMVEQGWAVAYRRHSNRYVNAQKRAKRRRAGIWSGSFDNPEVWRRR